jgi:hypothetical protein
MRARGILAIAAVAAILSACSSGDGNGDSAEADDGDFCSVASQLNQSVDATVTDPDEATFDEIEAAIDEARASAPGEIEEDLATLDEGFTSVREIFAEYDFDLTKLMAAAAADPEILTNMQTINGGEVEAAGNRVEAYVREHCGEGVGTGATSAPSG